MKHAQDRLATFWPCLESAVFTSLYLVTSGLATTLMSIRATLIEHVNDDSITVRLTMISTTDPSQPARNARTLSTVANDRSAKTMKSVESRSAIFATE